MAQHWSLEFLKFATHQIPSAVQIKDPKIEHDSAKSNLNELIITEEIPINSKSEDLTKHYEPPVQKNNAGESLYCDNRENEILKLELQEASEQCIYFETELEDATGDLTKANELLNAEKMYRSKVETERNSLACLAEKLELILLKYDQHFSSHDKITLFSSKMTHHWDLKNLNFVTHQLPFDVQIKEPKTEYDNVKTEIPEEILIEPKLEYLTEYYEPSLQNTFDSESLYCDNRDEKIANEQCIGFKIKFEAVNEELTKINESLNAERMFRLKAENDRDSLVCLVEKLELILFKYDQHFSSAGKTVESTELLDVKFTSGLDLKMEYESDTDPLLESSRPALISSVKDEISDEIDSMDTVSLSIIKNRGLSIQKSSVSKAATSNQRNCNTSGSKKKAEVMKVPAINNSPSCKNNSGLRCDICGKYYAGKGNLTKHKRNVHDGVKPHKCSECNQTFAQKIDLKRHSSVHSSQRPFQCSICNQCFKTAKKRIEHERVIHGDAGFCCAHCNRKFTAKYHLINHIAARHLPELGKPYKCATCGKSFLLKNDLNNHQGVHISERLHKCSMCEKSFKLRRDKYRHERRAHMEGFRFFCAHCDGRFRSKETLFYHIQRLHL